MVDKHCVAVDFHYQLSYAVDIYDITPNEPVKAKTRIRLFPIKMSSRS